jgi:predicted acyl esterase
LAGAALAAAAAPASALAGPLGLDDCEQTQEVHQCSGLVETWDGIPLDTTVTLPQEGAGDLPLVVGVHGFGNSKYEYLDPESEAYTGNAFGWAKRGYAVLTYTARGLWGSCGTPESRLANAVECADGYIHLADVRYEVRDTQELVGRLVDEGIADAGAIGVTGDSYGGGQSLMLAALRDRVMQPDGTLVPWRSPAGRRLRIAAAAPVIPWTDLITAAAPNGRVSATRPTSRERATVPVGVEKATVVNAIFAAAEFAIGPGQPVGEPFVPGRPMGYLAPVGTDPDADVTGWVARTDQGEPYDDPGAQAIVEKLVRFHSPYYVDSSRPPPPLLLGSGFTDDLFPVDEVTRFANRTRRRHPETPLSLVLGDFGHQRAANKPHERELLLQAIRRWFSHYLKGSGRAPRTGALAHVQTCPRSEPSLGPFRARSFKRLARGRLLFREPVPQTLDSAGGDPQVGVAIDPATGGGDGCVETTAATAPGTARYAVGEPRQRPLTLLGAPVLRADLAVTGADPDVAQVAGRLWDVAPNGKQRLVARGLLRPAPGANRWELHPGAWRFQPGHAIELELLGGDPPFARPSNGSFEVEVSNLRLRLPIRERRPGR